MNRLLKAIRIALSIIDMFKSQGVRINRADELEECPGELSLIIDDVERFADNLGWAELEKMALPGEQLDALAEHFRSTGQASA